MENSPFVRLGPIGMSSIRPAEQVRSRSIFSDGESACFGGFVAELLKKLVSTEQAHCCERRSMKRSFKSQIISSSQKTPNKAPEPMTMAVTPRAIVRITEVNLRNAKRQAAHGAP